MNADLVRIVLAAYVDGWENWELKQTVIIDDFGLVELIATYVEEGSFYRVFRVRVDREDEFFKIVGSCDSYDYDIYWDETTFARVRPVVKEVWEYI